MRVLYHPHAEAELIEAAQYYERSLAGLGGRFLDEAEAAVSLIRKAPQRWRIMEADVRRYLMPRFPFAIYYRAFPDHIRILAFKHHSRHPEYWRYRVE